MSATWAAISTSCSSGADFVKLYTLLPADAATGALAEAQRRGLPVVGHLPASMDVDTAVRNGMSGIEHMAVEVGGLCDLDDPADPCGDVFAQLREADITLTATLIVRERALTVRAIGEGARVLAGSDAGVLFVPPGVSLHDELRLLVDAGMSEIEALLAP